MDITLFFNDKFLKKTVNDVLTTYDKNNDGSYSREEISVFMDEARSSWAILGSIFYSKKKILNDIFKLFDYDNSKEITLEEFDTYLQKEYNLTLDSLKNKDVYTTCNLLKAEDDKKRNKIIKQLTLFFNF